ncbi:hypothetical protein PM082_015154 [Marasmius tenuissimus]|nr:hypothetical protein PM082_015154 [Marasmius tenuissimus]
MKADCNKVVTPNGGKYAEKLCEEAISWKRVTRLPLMQQPNSQSPLLVAKSLLDSKLMDYHTIKEEYFYATRDHTDQYWNEKRDSFTMYKAIVSEFVGVLELLQTKLDEIGHKVKLEDLSPIYRSVFWFCFPNMRPPST